MALLVAHTTLLEISCTGSYISRFGPFLKFQNFELHFLEGGGVGKVR